MECHKKTKQSYLVKVKPYKSNIQMQIKGVKTNSNKRCKRFFPEFIIPFPKFHSFLMTNHQVFKQEIIITLQFFQYGDLLIKDIFDICRILNNKQQKQKLTNTKGRKLLFTS